MQKKIFHPYLFAIYPALALLAHNIEEIKIQAAFRSLVISLLVCLLIDWLLGKLLKSRSKAALITTLTWVLFFSYGQVYNYLELVQPLGLALGRHRLLLPVWLLLFAVGVLWALRQKRDLVQLHSALNLVAAILLIFPMAEIGLFGFRSLTASVTETPTAAAASGLGLPSDQPAPDIYYIILDAYSRDDTLLENYRLDNRPFLEELEALGFYVARCSQSNYAQTQLSLVSSLNMNYLPALGDEFQPGNTSRVRIGELIHHNAVRRLLESIGYTSVAFETGFKGTQWEDADIYLSPSNNQLAAVQLLGGMTSFEEMLIRTSAGLAVIDSASALPKMLQPDLTNPKRIHRDLVLFVLEQLRKMPGKSSPKLVFAHLVIPHPPYVFEADGSFVAYDKPDNPGYQDQITYLNRILIPLLREMIERSPSPPIIILQADHGAINAPPNKRLNILNAYFLPGDGKEALYPNISPVNTFRLIFNQYFGGNYELLEDTAYFSVYSKPYDVTVIPNKRAGCP